MGKKYTSSSAEKFDTIFCQQYKKLANGLLVEAKRNMPLIPQYAELDSVEFDVECDAVHARDCRIRYVTLRYLPSGPSSDDFFAFLPGQIGGDMAAVRLAHDAAFSVG